jgi:hypothetical protein
VTGSYAPPKGVLLAEPYTRPLNNGAVMPFCYRYFYLTGLLQPAPVYQDGYLTTPYTQPITADANGRFSPIYLDPSIQYGSQLYTKAGVQFQYVDPVQPQVVNLASAVQTTQITTNSTSLANTGLTYTVENTGTYGFEFFMEVTANNNSSVVEFDVNFTGTINTSNANGYSSIYPGGQIAEILNSEVGYGLTTAGVRYGFWMRGVFTASSGGVLSLQWATSNSANTITMNAGAYMAVQPVGAALGLLFHDPLNQPFAASPLTQIQSNCYRLFYYSGTSTSAPVYADAGLQNRLSQIIGQAQPSCTADINGRFNPIYLDPAITYKCLLYSVSGTLLETLDPYVPRCFEPVTAVKPTATSRPTGAGSAADPALQVTLAPGVYQLSALLEIYCASAQTIGVTIGKIGGGGTITTSATAETLLALITGVGYTSGVLGSAISFTTGVGLTGAIFNGSVTVSGGTVVLGVSWNTSGTAGVQITMNPGSILVARQLG